MSGVTLLKRGGVAIALGATLVFAVPNFSAKAEALSQLLREDVEKNDRVVAAQAEVDAARNKAREALGAWFPTLTPTLNFGWERQDKPTGTADTSTGFREFDLKLSQLLWDFGATNAAVEKARLRLLQAEMTLVNTRQELIQEMSQAYVNLLRAEQVLDYARQSERNIQRQTGLEEARVEAGSGLSTDVLQAKTQLAGAEARRIQAEGSLVSAINRFRAVFNRAPPPVRALEPVTLEESRLPPDLDSAVRIADDSNIQLLQANLTEAIAREDVDETRGKEFFPKVEGVVEQSYKRNVAGTLDSQNETLAKIELSMPINLGGTQLNKLRAAQSTLLARVRTVSDTRRRVEEQVRNAWDQLKTARATATSRRNQASIANAFLELARKERQLGQRSLIDVLSGETNLINAQSDAASAEADVLIAAFGLLKTLGKLDYDTFRAMQVEPPPDRGNPPAGPSETTDMGRRPRLSIEGRARAAVTRSALASERASPSSAQSPPPRALPPRPYRTPELASLPVPAAEPPVMKPASEERSTAALPPPGLLPAPSDVGSDAPAVPMTAKSASTAAPPAESAAPSESLIAIALRKVENSVSSLFSAFAEGGRTVAEETRRGLASATASIQIPASAMPAAVPKATFDLPAAEKAETAATGADKEAVRSSATMPEESGPSSSSIDPLIRFFHSLFSDSTLAEPVPRRSSASARMPSSDLQIAAATPSGSTPTRSKATIFLPAGATVAAPPDQTKAAAAASPGRDDGYRPNPNDPIAQFFRTLFRPSDSEPTVAPTAPQVEAQSADREIAERSGTVSLSTASADTAPSVPTVSGSTPATDRQSEAGLSSSVDDAYRPNPNDPIARFFRALFGADKTSHAASTQAPSRPATPPTDQALASVSPPPAHQPVQPSGDLLRDEPYRPNPNDPILRFFRTLSGQHAATPAVDLSPQKQDQPEHPDPVTRFFSQVMTVFAQNTDRVGPPPAGR